MVKVLKGPLDSHAFSFEWIVITTEIYIEPKFLRLSQQNNYEVFLEILYWIVQQVPNFSTVCTCHSTPATKPCAIITTVNATNIWLTACFCHSIDHSTDSARAKPTYFFTMHDGNMAYELKARSGVQRRKQRIKSSILSYYHTLSCNIVLTNSQTSAVGLHGNKFSPS